MKYIIINKDKLKEKAIDKNPIRVKALIINSNNELLVGYSFNCYQFIGGHLEQNESIIDCLNREITEETGIKLNLNKINPFLIKDEYYKGPPNIKSRIYYFVVKTDLKPDISKVKYTNEEVTGNFTFKYIPISKIENIIKDNMINNEPAKIIGQEMLLALREYKKINQ